MVVCEQCRYSNYKTYITSELFLTLQKESFIVFKQSRPCWIKYSLHCPPLIYLSFFISFHSAFKTRDFLLHRGRNYKDKKCGNLNNNRRIERGNFGTFYTLINLWAQKLYWMDFTNLIGIHQNFYKPQEWRREPQDMRQHVSVDCPGISPITQLQFNSRLSWVLTSRDFNNNSSRSFHRARRCPLLLY